MANRDNPRGFTNPQSKTGSPIALTQITTSAEVFIGDPVLISETGTCANLAVGAVTGGISNVAASYAASGGTIDIYQNPMDLTFEIQMTGNDVTSSAVNQTFDLTQADPATTMPAGHPNYSGCEVDSTSGHASNGCVRVTDMVTRSDNDVSLTNNNVRVEFNNLLNAVTVN